MKSVLGIFFTRISAQHGNVLVNPSSRMRVLSPSFQEMKQPGNGTLARWIVSRIYGRSDWVFTRRESIDFPALQLYKSVLTETFWLYCRRILEGNDPVASKKPTTISIHAD